MGLIREGRMAARAAERAAQVPDAHGYLKSTAFVRGVERTVYVPVKESNMPHASTAATGVASHHADVPAKGGGGHGGNPNHDEHGRFT